LAANTPAAASTRSTRRGSGLLACPFGDGAGAAADQSLHMTAALGTLLNCSVAHLLTLLEVTAALFAKIFVGRQEISPGSILAALAISKELPDVFPLD